MSLLKGNPEDWIQDPSTIAKILHEIMESSAIPYFISEGVATIVHGQPRYTLDIDIVVALDRLDLPKIVALLE